MGIGIYLTGSADCDHIELLSQAELAERAGFDSVWLRERHFHRDHDGRNFFSSPMVAAAWIAGRTERIRIGLGARILTLDHPIHVAEAAASVDRLSNGRLDLGIARIGENDLYQAGFACDPDEARGRFIEALAVIESAWTGEPFRFEGEHFTVPEVAVLPRPVQRPGPPIHLVGISERTLAMGGERGMPLLLAAAQPEAEVARTVSTYRERLAEAGHDAGEVRLTLNRFVHVAETSEQARAQLGPAITAFLDRPASVIRDFLGARATELGEELLFDEVFICGDPDYCAERLAAVEEGSGASDLALTFNYFTLPHDRCQSSLELFASEVMPRVGSGAAADAVGSAEAVSSSAGQR